MEALAALLGEELGLSAQDAKEEARNMTGFFVAALRAGRRQSESREDYGKATEERRESA